MVRSLRFIYRFGMIKSLLLLIAMTGATEEYSLKWKGRQVHLRKGTSDFHVFLQVLAFEQYDVGKLDGKKVITIVDLGANIGLSTLYLKVKFPNAIIVAVEPDPDNFSMLKKNVAQLPGVHCVNKAIWHSSQMLGLFDTGGGAYSYLVKEESSEEKAAVPAMTMNELMAEFQLSSIDLLKIDIEGSEKELFAENCIPWLSKVDCVIIELHDWFRPGCASSFFRAINKREYSLSFKGENLTVVFEDSQEEPVSCQFVDLKNKAFAGTR